MPTSTASKPLPASSSANEQARSCKRASIMNTLQDQVVRSSLVSVSSTVPRSVWACVSLWGRLFKPACSALLEHGRQQRLRPAISQPLDRSLHVANASFTPIQYNVVVQGPHRPLQQAKVLLDTLGYHGAPVLLHLLHIILS